LKDEFEVDSENYLSVENIFSLSQRIARIIKELSNFSKRGEGIFKETSLEDVLETSLSLMKNRLEKAYIKIERDIDSPLPKVNIRYQEIQQVFVNIINNARQGLNDKFGRKTIDPNKKITIKGRVESINAQKYVKFSFRDEGIGIPEEELDKIFDPFFSTRRPGEAIGMGLSVCEKIMQEHNGKISAESKEGEYTKIILEFPMTESDE
jgi:signal transduction histidine kinase